ncbi:MAG: nucleoside deaminase [Pricia sp.]
MHEKYLKMAIQIAVEGRDSSGGGAFGAVIVRDSEVICKTHNLVNGKDDLTQHAELAAIQAACLKIGRAHLQDCILYTSCEPCMMCLGACHWAKFKAIYYGASAEDAQNYGFVYSKSYFDMDAELRRTEFKMTQLLREEALKVWK